MNSLADSLYAHRRSRRRASKASPQEADFLQVLQVTVQLGGIRPRRESPARASAPLGGSPELQEPYPW